MSGRVAARAAVARYEITAARQRMVFTEAKDLMRKRRLRPLSETGWHSAARVPESENLDGLPSLIDRVVEVIARTTQQHPSNTGDAPAPVRLAGSRQLRDQSQRVVEIVRKRRWCLVAVAQPPSGCFADLPTGSP